MAYYNYPNYMTPNWYGQQFYQPIQQPMQSQMQMSQQMQPPLTQAPQMQQQMPTQQSAIPTQTTQNQPTATQGVFVRVQSEQDARSYPVAPGNSVTFIDENAPFCYVKAVDASALDRPRFERYRLVKEEDRPTEEAPKSDPQYALVTDVEALMQRITALERRLKREAKKEVATDEPSGE